MRYIAEQHYGRPPELLIFALSVLSLTLTYRYSVAIMMDTEGSEIHTQELDQPIKADVSYALHSCKRIATRSNELNALQRAT